ncbi:MAG: hypothetical protein AVDCRST_MAG24-1704, partial [uncultured Nocardioidaceae bacterium]
ELRRRAPGVRDAVVLVVLVVLRVLVGVAPVGLAVGRRQVEEGGAVGVPVPRSSGDPRRPGGR